MLRISIPRPPSTPHTGEASEDPGAAAGTGTGGGLAAPPAVVPALGGRIVRVIQEERRSKFIMRLTFGPNDPETECAEVRGASRVRACVAA